MSQKLNLATILLGSCIALTSCVGQGASLSALTDGMDTDARKSVNVVLARKSPGYGAVYRAAIRHRVDVGFALSIAKIESGGKCHLVSPKGARGVMQVMPGTARPHGISRRRLMTCEGSAEAGVLELKRLLAHPKVRGNKRLAAIAYNCGEGCLRRHRLPKETRRYIRIVK